MTATSTSCPCPTRLGGDWYRALGGGGGEIVVWGKGGGCEAMETGLLLAGFKD